MTHLKLQRALKKCGLNGMQVTANAVLEEIRTEADALAGLTSSQLAAVMRLVQSNYHKGRASTGCEIIDDDGIWIESLQKIYDLSDIKKIGGGNHEQ